MHDYTIVQVGYVAVLMFLPPVTIGDTDIFNSFSSHIQEGKILEGSSNKLQHIPKIKSLSTHDVYNYIKFAAIYYCYKPPTQWCKTTHSIATNTFTNSTFNTMGVVFLNQDNQEIIVSFRGTHGFPDAVLNILIPFVTPQHWTTKHQIRIHQGFWMATMSIYESIVGEVQRLLRKNENVESLSIVGASLGGAMASVATFLINDHYPFNRRLKMSLVTFGQPRVGNIHFANYLNALPMVMGRVVYKSDPVPQFPPESKLLEGYVHHLQEIWIPVGMYSGGDMTFCSMKLYEDTKCLNSLKMAYNIFDHWGYFALLPDT